MTHSKARQALLRFYARHPVVEMHQLKEVLQTTSRTTVFRALSNVGYFSSYSHAGRFYTLQHVPDFDESGLWGYQDVLFSKLKTLRATIIHLVEQAPAGHTHAELQERVRLRVHDTLHDLVTEQHLHRFDLDDMFVYVSVQANVAERQIAERKNLVPAATIEAVLPEPTVVIDVLLALIRHPSEDAEGLARRLRQRGIRRPQVDAVLQHYGVGKKKRDSGHSPP